MTILPVGLARRCKHFFAWVAQRNHARQVFLSFLFGAVLIGTRASAQTLPPFSADFESASGYTLGSLATQNGWQVPAGSALVTDETAFAGTFSVGLQPGSVNVNITHAFAQMSGSTVTWIDFETKPTVASSFDNSATLTVEGSGTSGLRHIVIHRVNILAMHSKSSATTMESLRHGGRLSVEARPETFDGLSIYLTRFRFAWDQEDQFLRVRASAH